MNMNLTLDLDRYPLDQPGSQGWHALVETSRQGLRADGMFSLEGFLRPGVAEQAARAIAPRVATEAFTHKRLHNIYFKPEIPGLDPDHPALRKVETVNHTMCADQIPDSVLMQIYRFQPFIDFLAAVMGKPALHVMDDELASVNVMTYHAGEALNWHFDRSEFTITLLLQAPQGGGEFEYRSDLRTDTDPNHDGVARLLEGQDPEVRRIGLSAGALNVFLGRNTAHRVTPVQGPSPRMIAVLCYYEQPGVRFSEQEQQGFYGRVA